MTSADSLEALRKEVSDLKLRNKELDEENRDLRPTPAYVGSAGPDPRVREQRRTRPSRT